MSTASLGPAEAAGKGTATPPQALTRRVAPTHAVAPVDPRAPLNHRQILALQRTAGNAAMSSVVQRQPVTLRPVVISNDPTTEAHEQQLVDEAARRAPTLWRGFCGDWFTAAVAGLSASPDPADPFAARNFAIALGGNIAWALTSLSLLATAPLSLPVAAGLIAVSISGAVAGSGTLSRSAPPTGRGQITDVLARDRDLMEQAFPEAQVNDLLADLSQRRALGDAAAFDRGVWSLFSSAIPFESRTQIMTQNATNRVSRWLQQFQQQVLEWRERDDVKRRARDLWYEEKHALLEESPLADLGGWLTTEFATPPDEFYERAMSDYPLVILFTG